jgi:hypothetical protein
MTSHSPQKLIVAAVATILLALFNAYLVRRALRTGKIRSKMAVHERNRDRFSFYTTVYLHVIFTFVSLVCATVFLWEAAKAGSISMDLP